MSGSLMPYISYYKSSDNSANSTLNRGDATLKQALEQDCRLT